MKDNKALTKTVIVPKWTVSSSISAAVLDLDKAQELATCFKENYPEIAQYLESTTALVFGDDPVEKGTKMHEAMSIWDWWECLEPESMPEGTQKTLERYRRKRAPKKLLAKARH